MYAIPQTRLPRDEHVEDFAASSFANFMRACLDTGGARHISAARQRLRTSCKRRNPLLKGVMEEFK